MKKWIALSTVTIMVFSILTACSGSGNGSSEKTPDVKQTATNSNLTASGLPIVNTPITIKMFGTKRFDSQNYNDIKIWNEYKKMTNITVEWTDVPSAQSDEKRNIVLASGEYPDAFFGSGFNVSDLQKYGQQGVFIKLNDLINKHAPNIKKLIDENPDIKKAITMPDGNIYSLPTINDPSFKALRSGTFLWYKKELIDQLGMTVPKTTDELYSFLKQVKEKDPNMIPFGGYGISPVISQLQGAWGLGNRGKGNPYVDVDPKTESLRFIPASTEYKEMLQYVTKLYSEGLLEKETFSANGDQMRAIGTQGKYALYPGYFPEISLNQKGYVSGESLKGPNGDQLYANVRPLAMAIGQFVITSSNKNPEATMRWIDYLYSDEGSKMFFMGFENVTYTKTADGQLQYTDEIVHNPKGLTQDQAIGQYLAWPGGSYAGIVKQQFFKGPEGLPASIEAIKKVESNFPKEIWPSFTFTTEESDKMSALQTDIGTYVNEMRAKFITGNVPFSDWDKYTATLQKMGLDDYMKIYEAAYDRYKK
ncbi:extracellular solute-binding protein [Paenibacillus sp. KQZ6P-2]|uniref:Extracellular solute-binding protein n=1 Tax=Paenibacillus mangrovi TaxID=2931978 RepID=A0A9X1WM85_9BACL|nr:extracellular solute-binding protein [Paenibacillus mangrovi]MCJ8011528.1 extracellular solute-binding protein [Paenibacillus mangrovi]